MSKMTVRSKIAVFATILALILATISATSVFAASSRATATPNERALAKDLASNWKFEVESLHIETIVDKRVGKWVLNWLDTKNNDTSSNRATADRYIDNFNLVLRQAEAVISKHAGFDSKGQVTNTVQATKSVNDLAMYLHELRVALMDKLVTLFE